MQTLKTPARQLALLVAMFATLSLTACPSAPPKKVQHPTQTGDGNVPPPSAFDAVAFAQRESAIYHHVDDLLRTCTIETNAQAGLKWVETLLGEKLAAQPPAAQLKAAMRALDKARSQSLDPGELADLGWLVAETLRQAHGGTYAFDAKTRQVSLQVGPGGDTSTLRPMEAIGLAYAGQKSLSTQLDSTTRLSPKSGDLPDCKDVRPVDVLKRRMRWK